MISLLLVVILFLLLSVQKTQKVNMVSIKEMEHFVLILIVVTHLIIVVRVVVLMANVWVEQIQQIVYQELPVLQDREYIWDMVLYVQMMAVI